MFCRAQEPNPGAPIAASLKWSIDTLDSTLTNPPLLWCMTPIAAIRLPVPVIGSVYAGLTREFFFGGMSTFVQNEQREQGAEKALCLT
jgi:hypothetical protein